MLGRSLREDVGEEFEGGWWGRSLRVCGGEEFEGPSEYCGSRDHTLGCKRSHNAHMVRPHLLAK